MECHHRGSNAVISSVDGRSEWRAGLSFGKCRVEQTFPFTETRTDRVTEYSREAVSFSPLPRRQVVADFNGRRLTSNAGVLLLREVVRRSELSEAISGCPPDPRNPIYVVHGQRQMLAQRIFALAAGYEDLNDHQTLRDDPVHGQQDGRFSTGTAAITVSCRCTCSAADTSCARCCGRPTSIRRNTPAPSSSCWSTASAGSGRRCGSSCGATAVSAAARRPQPPLRGDQPHEWTAVGV